MYDFLVAYECKGSFLQHQEMGKWREDKNSPLPFLVTHPSWSFTVWEEASVSSNKTKILNIDFEENLRED